MSLRRAVLLFLLALCCIAVPASGAAQTAANILVVVNDASEDSVRVAEHYVRARQVPETNVVHLTTASTENVQRAEFLDQIESPIAKWLARHGLQDQILYIVLTKGIPLRVPGTGGLQGTTASVDSELTLLYRRMVGHTIPLLGREANPYFLSGRPVDQAGKFTRRASDLYLVTRLDGYTVEDVFGLIDRGLSPSRDGRIVLDQRANLFDSGGDRWLFEAASALRSRGAADRVVLESSKALATTDDLVLGYYSWGSNDSANQLRGTGGLRFAPGGLAAMFVSTDGRTMQEPPADWKPGPSNRPHGQFGSGSQSMAADFIREGAAGVSAHVAEPYLDGTVRPQTLFPAYLAGFNLAESFYLAVPYLSWQTVIIGDPLVAPFRDGALRDDEIHAGMDADTELPALFAERRLRVMSAPNLNPAAVKLALRAEARTAREDEAGAERLLAEALDLEPRLGWVALRLAWLHEDRGEHAEARTRYRQVLDVEPNHVIALNNLAYSLAVHGAAPREGLPLAERALRLSGSAMAADTVAWIHHLLGNGRLAAEFVERALVDTPDSAEIRLHAAAIHAALGQLARARVELAAAVKLDPALTNQEQVRELQARTAVPEPGSGGQRP
jgi:uncharacterized protein (TIGR03790 family)